MRKMSMEAQVTTNGGQKITVWECRGCGYWILDSVRITIARFLYGSIALGRCPKCTQLSWKKKDVYV